MGKYIDEKFWNNALKKDNWYELIADDFKRIENIASKVSDYTKRKRIKREAYQLVEKAVKEGGIALAIDGPNLDEERKLIDTIVIHHTKNRPSMTLERLNAIQLIRIYGMYYANPTDPRESYFKGKPIWSGHFFKGEQVFWGYHWLIREDGLAEHILDDKYVGWHAGNWDVNTRSIGICIDDDLSEKEPNINVINSIADLIRLKYSHIDHQNIVGHLDININTDCPGHLFYEDWRLKIIDRIKSF